MKKQEETLFDLIDQAMQMYLDRSKQERDLIYAIAKLDDDARSALILAYQALYPIV